MRWETTPALRTGEFFTAMARLGPSASVLDRAATAWHYRDVYRGTGILGAVTPLVAVVARAAGTSSSDIADQTLTPGRQARTLSWQLKVREPDGGLDRNTGLTGSRPGPSGGSPRTAADRPR